MENSSKKDQEIRHKNVILITALHHSREPLTVTMIIYMTVKVLRGLRHDKHNEIKELMRDNVIFFLPMLNIDSYQYIAKNWHNELIQEKVMMIRKNRNIDVNCD